jgi:hypothetical protein
MVKGVGCDGLDLKDRDGATTACSASTSLLQSHVFTGQGFTGWLVGRTCDTLDITLDTVRKLAGQKGFAMHSRRREVCSSLFSGALPVRTCRDTVSPGAEFIVREFQQPVVVLSDEQSRRSGCSRLRRGAEADDPG